MSDWLERINWPQDLRQIPVGKLGELAQEIRDEIIGVVSRNGGHLASNLGAVELTLALHRAFDSSKDRIVWDVGHQCYTHKLLTGRKGSFETLRKYQGLSGFPTWRESDHDVLIVGHASTAISSALGIACGRDYNKEDFAVVAVVGDGALTGGMAFEGLNNAGASGRDMIVILNDNTMSISKNVGALSRYLTDLLTDEKYNKLKAEVWDLLGKFKRRDRIRAMVTKVEESVKGFLVPGIIFEKLGFRYFGPVDGHDIGGLIKTLEHLKGLKGPILLHALTQKGRGYKHAEEDAPRFHGIGAFDKVTGNSNGKTGGPTYTQVFGRSLLELAREDERIVAITAAMTLGTGLLDFAKAFPARFYDVGIAEQHATAFASGLATRKLRPVFAVYSTFLQRAFDQAIHDVALQKLPVILAIDRAGLVGADGPTHHGAFDLSYLRQIPNWTIMAPKDGNELKSMLDAAVKWDQGPIAIRYPRSAIPDTLSVSFSPIQMGSWEKLKKGKDLAILAVGSMVYPALDACSELRKEGVDAEVVNARFVKPLDEKMLDSVLKRFDKVLTVEENALSGGFGCAVLEFAEAHDLKDLMVKRMGIPDEFVEHGSRAQLLSDLELDKDGIVRMVRKMSKSSFSRETVKVRKASC